MREEDKGLDERDPRLGLTYRRLLGEQRGEPLRFPVCPGKGVLLVSGSSALMLSHPVALISAYDFRPALDLYEVDPRWRDCEQVDLVDRPVGGDEFEERKPPIRVVIGEPLAYVIERIPLPRELRSTDFGPAARVRSHRLQTIFAAAAAVIAPVAPNPCALRSAVRGLAEAHRQPFGPGRATKRSVADLRGHTASNSAGRPLRKPLSLSPHVVK
jgi:hypothetical protein